ncbi:MAG: tRNA pseudouridine synthase A [Acidimicrobiales bacterium]
MTDRIVDPPPAGFVRVRMRVGYAYSGFSGFARNPGVRTVQGELERALATALRHDVAITGAGRTDAGVHARGQVVSFDAAADHFEPVALGRAVNRMLGPEIVVDRVEPAGAGFDARWSCRGRTYRYHVWNAVRAEPSSVTSCGTCASRSTWTG